MPSCANFPRIFHIFPRHKSELFYLTFPFILSILWGEIICGNFDVFRSIRAGAMGQWDSWANVCRKGSLCHCLGQRPKQLKNFGQNPFLRSLWRKQWEIVWAQWGSPSGQSHLPDNIKVLYCKIRRQNSRQFPQQTKKYRV